MQGIMNTAQARVADPILSTHARGYTQEGMVFQDVAPVVDVPATQARVLAFGKDAFRVMNTARAPGANTKVTGFNYTSDPISISEDALDASVPRELQEEASVMIGFDLSSAAVNNVLNIMDNGHELAVAKLVSNPNNYGSSNKMALSGTDMFDHANCDPIQLIEGGCKAVARQIGRRPNTLTIGLDVFTAFRNNKEILSRMKLTSDKIVTAQILASLFEVEKVVVSRGVYLDEMAKETDEAKSFYSKIACLSFVNRAGSYLSPGHMYSYRRKGYPVVEKPEWDRSSRSMIYGTTQMRTPVITGKDAAFLFTNAVA
jgi:hypothetical protein